MVGLDMSIMDDQLINYVAFLSYYLQPEQLYFIHVQQDLDIPKEVREAYPQLEEPLDEQILQEIQSKVDQHFTELQSFPVSCEVLEGNPAKTLLRRAHIKQVDLLIVGQKSYAHGSGVVPSQLVREGKCALLFVPETATCTLNKIMVANDFSAYSKKAMNTAIALSKLNPDIRVISEHVYSLPLGYYKSGKTADQFAEIMEKHARDRYTQFMRQVATNGTVTEAIFELNSDKASPANLILEQAEQQEADVIVMGSHGRSGLAALLLGSVTEKMIRLGPTVPLLVVRDPDSAPSFWENLLKSTA